MDKMLQEIRARIERETRTPGRIWQELRSVGATAIFSNTLCRADVIQICAGILAMYGKLSGLGLKQTLLTGDKDGAK